MLKWVFGADTGPFRQGLAQMRKDVSAFSGGVKGQIAGVFGIAAITAWGKAMIDQAGRIDDLSKRLNTTAESVQRIGYAAEQAGAGIEVTAKGLTTLQRNLAEVERGSTSFDDSAKSLGINLKEIKDLAPEQQLVEIARGYANSTDKGQALASVMQLMGKSGAELAPLLSEGPEALAEAMDAAQVATEGEIQTLARMGDQLDRLKSFGIKAAGTLVTGVRSIGAYASYGVDSLMGFGDKDSRDDKLTKDLDRIINGDREAEAAKKTVEAAQEAAEEFQRAAEDRKKLEEEIAKLEEDAAMKRLSIEQQIAKLKEEQREAETKSYESGGSDLEAKKQELEITKQIQELEKQRDDAKRAEADELAALSQSLAEAAKREADVDKENRRAAMTDEEKLKDLKREQAQLIKESRDSEKAGQHLDAIEKRTAAKSMNGEIQSLQHEINMPKIPTIVASDMRQWGGSTRFAETFQQGKGMEVRQDKTNDLLQSIDRKLPERGGTASTEPSTPF